MSRLLAVLASQFEASSVVTPISSCRRRRRNQGGPVRRARWGCLSVNRRGRPSCGGLLTFRLRPKAPRRRSGRAARPLAVSSPVGFACKPQDTLLWPRRYSYFEPTGLFAVFWCSTLARDGAVHQQRNARQVHLKRRPASRLPCAAT